MTNQKTPPEAPNLQLGGDVTRNIIFGILALCLMSANVMASMSVTYINTTAVLNRTTSAKIVETVLINISNSSINQYLQDRQAINLTLGGWGRVLHTQSLIQQVFNPNSSISNFTLLPGPIIGNAGYGGYAKLTMIYTAYNITTIRNVGPRKFDYSFNSQSLNFEHTASGEALPQNTRFNIIIPKGIEVVSVYPEPDYPYPNFGGNYNNVTMFSWYAGEPLSKFTFSYIVMQSLQDEVISYFSGVYATYTQQIYLLAIILAGVLSIYIYSKVFAE
ncbi:hypothetical protein M1590_03000 [Candidatus Marsarchaeota archaeon]|nr:hypothetical protein [Candidatus Marsarchaeota archaeon]